MKILLVYNRYQYRGGEDTYFDSLVTLLKKQGHRVITYIKDSRNIKKDLISQLKVGLGMLFNWKVQKELTTIIRQSKPDIAHFHNVYPLITPIAYRVCKKFNIPIVQTIHNYKFMCPKNSLFRNGKKCELCVKKPFFYPSIFFGCYHDSRLASFVFSLSFLIYKTIKTFHLIDKFIFPSPYTRDYYIKNMWISRKKTTVLPYFMFERDILRKKKNTLISKKNDYFLFLGRLSEDKGIIELLEIFKSIPQYKLKVIGDGPLREKIQRYNLYKNIQIKEHIPHRDVFHYINSARAVIVPSLCYEVLPNVVIESLLCGVPVIAPANGNFERFIKHKSTGLLYKDGNFDELKHIICLIGQGKITFSKESIHHEYERRYLPYEHYIQLVKSYEKLIKITH